MRTVISRYSETKMTALDPDLFLPLKTNPNDAEVILNKGSIIVTPTLEINVAGYYSFNGDANDGSLNTNNGTVNGPTLTIDEFDVPDNAYLFAGATTNNEIIIPDNASLDFSTALTIMIRFKPEKTGDVQELIAKDQHFLSTPTNAYGIRIEVAGTITAGVGDGTNNVQPTSSNAVNWSEWNYVIFSWTSGDYFINLNGTVTTGSSADVTTIQNLADDVWIGRNNAGSNQRPFKGVISEVLLTDINISQTDATNLTTITSSHKLDEPYIPKVTTDGEVVKGYDLWAPVQTVGTTLVGTYIVLDANVELAKNAHCFYFEYVTENGGFQRICSMNQDGTAGRIDLQTSNNTIYLESYTNNSWSQSLSLGIDINDGKLHKYLIEFNSDATRIYVDGTLAATGTSNSDASSSIFRYRYFGSGEDGGVTYGSGLPGTLANVALFDKILTEAERTELFGVTQSLKDVIENPKVVQSTGENNAATIFTGYVENIAGENKDMFKINDVISVFVGDDLDSQVHIFEGFITIKKDGGKGSQNDNVYITAKDFYAKLQDKTIEPTTFRDIEFSEIVKEIITTNGIQLTTNHVFATSLTHPGITYKHNRADDGINNLAKDSNNIVYVDTNKDLHFEEKNTISSGVTLESGVNIISENFTEKRAGMANKVWVYGNKVLTRAPTYNFIFDGGSVVTLPQRPHNTQAYVAGSLQKGNVFEFANTIPSGTDYLVDFDKKRLVYISGTQAGNNVPASGVSGSVIYDKESIIARFGQDDDSIKNYGPVEDVIIDDKITTTQHAQTVVNTELAERADPFKSGDIVARNIEVLQVGRTVEVIIPNSNINATYNILQIEYDLTPKMLELGTIQKIKVAKKINNLTDTLKEILAQLRSQGATNINVGDLLSIVRFANETPEVDIHWDAYTRNIGDTFILGNSGAGILGDPDNLLGSQTGSFSLHASGGDF